VIARRLGKASARRIAVDEVMWMLEQYESHYAGWNVKHFHEHLQLSHGRPWSYSWVKTKLQDANPVPRRRLRATPHRRKRERKPCESLMLHQEGSRAAWLAGQPALDLVVTMDDAISTIYSALLVEEGRHRLDVSRAARGVPGQGPAVQPL
jgi:hypothetical protein